MVCKVVYRGYYVGSCTRINIMYGGQCTGVGSLYGKGTRVSNTQDSIERSAFCRAEYKGQ